MNKLNYLGIGPKIGGISIPWLALMVFISVKFKPLFALSTDNSEIILYFGIFLVVAGFVLYFSTLPLLLRGVKETKLITSGAFSLSRNPLYASFILLIMPGTALIVNSWLVLTSSILAYILFKINIKSEYREMESFFGDKFKNYVSETPELFPFKIKKWFKKRRNG